MRYKSHINNIHQLWSLPYFPSISIFKPTEIVRRTLASTVVDAGRQKNTMDKTNKQKIEENKHGAWVLLSHFIRFVSHFWSNNLLLYLKLTFKSTIWSSFKFLDTAILSIIVNWNSLWTKFRIYSRNDFQNRKLNNILIIFYRSEMFKSINSLEWFIHANEEMLFVFSFFCETWNGIQMFSQQSFSSFIILGMKVIIIDQMTEKYWIWSMNEFGRLHHIFNENFIRQWTLSFISCSNSILFTSNNNKLLSLS